MSLVWPDEEKNVPLDKPAMHALVIGVGHYPHLPQGGGPQAGDAFGLGQLTTPIPTVKAIGEWLLGSYADPDCELGSLELLVSPGQKISPRGLPEREAERATTDAIVAAVNRWKARCSAKKTNKAFFYFCGHGLHKGSQFILPEDFGDPAKGIWDNCINFDAMRNGLRSCKAQTQLYFVDACRETPFNLLTQLEVSGRAVTAATVSDKVECWAVYRAASETRRAFGLPNEVSFFGQALLECLRGAATKNMGQGRWRVNTGILANSLNDMMGYFARKTGHDLSCQVEFSGEKTIHHPVAPHVLTSLSCRKNAKADALASFTLTNGADKRTSALGAKRPMEERLAPGTWTIEVSFSGGKFAPVPAWPEPLAPPIFEGVDLP